MVDDELVNRLMLKNFLEEHSYSVECAGNGSEAVKKIRAAEQHYSLVLLDLRMPVMNGLEFLDMRRDDEQLKQIPVIVMTADVASEIESIRRGAADFIVKPFKPDVVIARCDRIIELSEDRTIIQAAERDDLTGLYAKDFFFEYIRQMEYYEQDAATEMDAVMLDIDHFHLTNEMYGREFGNSILRTIGEAIVEYLSVRDGGIACRCEADTFYIYAVRPEDGGDYQDLIGMIGRRLSDRFGVRNIRVRAGICEADKSLESETWFDRAKMACDRVRSNYTQQTARYDSEIHARSVYEERLIKDFDEAIAKKHFQVFYQPKYAIGGSRPVLCSAEALIRWQHPELGLVRPGDFIPLFEGNGLIQKLDYYVWEEAAARAEEWKREFGFSIPVSVNVSRIDIYDPSLMEKLLAILERHSLNPSELMLEITESAYADNADRLLEVVHSLRERGFRIEMDDFGSGYSSLNMLTSLPIDVLKMDMRFVRNMMKDERSRRLVELVIDIAGFLRVPLVAEGVEEEEQLKALKEMGCDVVQGFYFSRPVPPDAFRRFAAEEKKNREKEVKGEC